MSDAESMSEEKALPAEETFARKWKAKDMGEKLEEAKAVENPYNEPFNPAQRWHAVVSTRYESCAFVSSDSEDNLKQALTDKGGIKEVFAIYEGRRCDFYEKREVVFK